MSLILIADDDPQHRQEISGILKRAGCHTVVVNGGRDALDAAHRQTFDLIFLDVAMPELNGLQALCILRKRHPHVKVCMLTALDSPDLLAQATHGAAVDWLPKPVQAEEMLRIVDKWCTAR